MTSVPGSSAARLVVVLVVDTSNELTSPAMLSQLSLALDAWAEAARADGRRGRARVAVVGAGDPPGLIAARPGVGSAFADMADVVAPALSAGGRPRWTEAVRLALELGEHEVSVAAGGGAAVPILLFLVDDFSRSKVPAADLAAEAALSADLGTRGRKRKVYVVAAGRHKLEQSTEKLALESYFWLDGLSFTGAFDVMTRAIDALTRNDPLPPDPQSMYDNLRKSVAEAARPAPVTTASAGLGKAPTPPASAPRAESAPVTTPYVYKELPPLQYGRSGRERATITVLVMVLVAVGVIGWLVVAGRPGLAFAALGVFLVLTVGLLFAVRD